ncbi:hypothetical protein PRIPAC_91883 [Pristionchus pacificus]|uniref:Metalloendopeptidase n=1 Tax=Pristionchus pacificus TaxID=54126 RepID=A0A2A6CV28_PRIPA|nr:hypothetical protein PRIPAC_91883 [Pristionchus pacificus]|eukprot:PDM81978.1 metallopeptidase [Pristionchus pacificus]
MEHQWYIREMLGLALLVAAAVNAAPVVEGKLPFLPEVFQNTSSFFDAGHRAEALARFQSSIGGQNSAALEAHKDTLRAYSAAHSPEYVLPELRPDVIANQVKMAARKLGAGFDRPSIAEINKPIAEYLYGADVMVAPSDVKPTGGSAAVAHDETDISGIRHKRGAPVVTSVRWPKTQPIAFIFNSDIDEPTRTLIRTATQKIADNTCLTFKENATVGSQLQFHRGGGCWSYIGNAISGKQLISIDSGCGYIGIISHEISHALGLDHTQNRKDRDAYVQVNTAAVASNNLNNFAKLTDAQNNNFGVPYDYGSDMHYGAYDFSTNGQAVIVANDADYLNTMGQRKKLTFNDYKMLNTLYECSSKCPTQIVCQNGGYPSPKDCNACVCSDFYSGANCQTQRTTMKITGDGKTIYHQDYDAALYSSGNNYNWDKFGKDAVKIITAPAGKKIRVTIDKIYAAYGGLGCYVGCPFVGLEFVDNANGDLSTMGKIYCCTKDEGYSFVSKGNVIGYKAYASPGMPFDAAVTYTVV